jgi:hypothetical protein
MGERQTAVTTTKMSFDFMKYLASGQYHLREQMGSSSIIG